jgi:hypothetical protein
MATKGIFGGCKKSLELIHAIFGIGTEIIELRDSTGATNTVEELGDIMWYVALCAQATNLTFTVSSQRLTEITVAVQGLTGSQTVVEVTKPTRIVDREIMHSSRLLAEVIDDMLRTYGDMLDVLKRHLFYWPGESALFQLAAGHNLGSQPRYEVSGRDITNKRDKFEADAVRFDKLLADLIAYVGVMLTQTKAGSTVGVAPSSSSSEIGKWFTELTDANIAKLAARYPDKFSVDLAETRNTDAEAQAVESKWGSAPSNAVVSKVVIVESDRPE